MTSLQAELQSLADAIALPDSDLHKRIESALYAAVKRAREPSDAMIREAWLLQTPGSIDTPAPAFASAMRKAWIAMHAQLLREIE